MGGSLNHKMIDDGQAGEAQNYADKYGEPGFDDPSKMYISQRYEGYTEENQTTWTELYDRQMDYLVDYGRMSGPASHPLSTGRRLVRHCRRAR